MGLRSTRVLGLPANASVDDMKREYAKTYDAVPPRPRQPSRPKMHKTKPA